MPYLDAACPLFERCPWRCLCAARALPYTALRCLRALVCYRCTVLCCLCTALRCLAHACTLPCARPCITLRMLVRCFCPIVGNLHVVEPMPLFPLHVFSWSCPQGLGRVRPWRGHGPHFPSGHASLKEHFRPFSEFLEETSKWLRRYNIIFT